MRGWEADDTIAAAVLPWTTAPQEILTCFGFSLGT